MRTIAIDDPGVCQFITRLRCAKTAERIDVLFGVETPGDRKSIKLDGGYHLPRQYEGGSMRPLTNYFGHLLKETVELGH